MTSSLVLSEAAHIISPLGSMGPLFWLGSGVAQHGAASESNSPTATLKGRWRDGCRSGEGRDRGDLRKDSGKTWKSEG